MNSTTKILITTVLTTLTVLAFGSVLASSLLPMSAAAHNGATGAFGGKHGGRRDHGAALQRCSQFSATHLRIAEFAVATTLDLNDDQQEALAPIMGVLDDWRSNAVAACDTLSASDDLDSHLGAMASLLSASATAMEAARPHIGEFYSVLDAEQRGQISAMLERHHGSGRGHH